eukprot:gnl/TRDRNA2_/TRDRNA2_82409_c0_seq1.p1 gnl/TRDRNA2_/TRDRNA2_82409_c0~~gnl/TRDRNA2_/TRDRNA2_82409_c0_seq1.p1  ORF type:complete len:320 (-),score=57.29 gnl/TRDRNA2_/TRDRNA2_82409_c0_seq1:189-1148(-)
MASESTTAAASIALAGRRGQHATMRLDSFLRTTDMGYQHGENATTGDRFVRKMATYGQVRPSVSFTSESRATRPFYGERSAIDMSSLPPPWMDPRDDPRELTLSYERPPEINNDYVALYKNESLMLPSERFKEHLAMKAGEKEWKENREKMFFYKKRMRILDRNWPQGVLGIDSPMHPDTVLYKERRDYMTTQQTMKEAKAEDRYNQLTSKYSVDDATSNKNFSSQPELGRSQDIPIQRKCVDKDSHPHRFLDTHDRLFPSYVPVWDPERAKAFRSHDVRKKQHNIISGASNQVTYELAPSSAPSCAQMLQLNDPNREH